MRSGISAMAGLSGIGGGSWVTAPGTPPPGDWARRNRGGYRQMGGRARRRTCIVLAKRCSVIPAVAIALGQGEGTGRAPGTGRIGGGLDAVRDPAGFDGIDPGPGGLDLVASHEQGLVVLDHLQQQALVGD